MSTRTYPSPGAFKAAFKRRFQGQPRLELVVLMQRFAARVCRTFEQAVVKGGLGLEMRLDQPRTTKDADIIIAGSHDLYARLSAAGQLDLGEHLRFTIEPEAEFKKPGMVYAGERYRVQARFAGGPPPWPGDPYRSFSAEISVRQPAGYDEIPSAIEGFPQAEVAPIRVYSLAWQLAEKLHAYTDPRHTQATDPNLMRPRDLLDMCRCAVAVTPRALVESQALRHAIRDTFEQRRAAAARDGETLPEMPSCVPPLPRTWTDAYVKAVEEAKLPWRSPAEAHEVAGRFLDPILDDSAAGRWDPTRGRWCAADDASGARTQSGE